MKTKLCISTIFYDQIHNDLESRLNFLIDTQYIDWWAYICHFADADDKKQHYHILLQPNHIIDTEKLRESGFYICDKTYSCLPFRISKNIGDWVLYSLHDKDYLLQKNLIRHYNYNWSDLKSSDSIAFFQYEAESVKSINSMAQRYIAAFQKGLTPYDMVLSGSVTLQNIGNVYRLYNAYCDRYNETVNKIKNKY